MTAPKSEVTICAVVLTLNEEKLLGRCLDSLGWADDLVVIDSGSTDQTAQVARECGARVLTHKQLPPFLIAEQRNWALDHSQTDCDWVIFFDADETVGDELTAELHRILASPQTHDAYDLTPRYWYLGAWMRRCMNYPNWHPRLVRRNAGVRFAGGVWEHFEVGHAVGRVETPYEHFGNSKGLSEWVERHDRYSDWEAKSVFEYLRTGDQAAFGTTRRLRLRRMAGRLWPLRPPMRFLVMYILRRGFLDGWPALLFAVRYSFYEYMTVEKIIEMRRESRGEPL
jgi:glycosyltransferase involved in cell wall biosynthesis